jgi:hypothetical protein
VLNCTIYIIIYYCLLKTTGMSRLKITSRSAMRLSWNILSVFLYYHNVCMCTSILPSVHHYCFPCPNLSHTFSSPFRSLVFLSVNFFVHQKHVTVISHSYCPPFHSQYCYIVLSLSSFTCLIILISVSTDTCFLISNLSFEHPHVHMCQPHSTNLQDDSEGNLTIGELKARNISSKKFI